MLIEEAVTELGIVTKQFFASLMDMFVVFKYAELSSRYVRICW